MCAAIRPGLGLVSGFSLAQRLIREATPLTITTTRASGRTGPNGVTRLANNVPYRVDRMVAGVQLAFYGVWGSATNIMSAQNAGSLGLSSNSLSGISRTLVEDTASSGHRADSSSALVLADGELGWLSAYVQRGVGARNGGCYFGNDTNRAGFFINLTTGVATAYSLGNGVVDVAPTSERSGNGWLVRCRVSSPAWGASKRLSSYFSHTGTAPSSYTGDGVSSLIFTGVTLTNGPLPTPLLPEGATDLADQIQTQPLVIGEEATVLVVGSAYGTDWAAGTLAHAVGGRWVSHQSDTLQLRRSAGDDCQRNDSVATRSASTSSLAVVDRSLTTRGIQCAAGTMIQRRNGAVAATIVGATPPWSQISEPLRIGNNSSLGRPLHGLVSTPLLWPRVLSAAELAALEYAITASGRDLKGVAL